MARIPHKPDAGIGYYMRQILSEVTDPVIFEIGVHFAEDTAKTMSMCNGFPEYYGFEPDPRNIEKIKEQKLPYQLNLNQAAVGNEDGEIDFYLQTGKHPNGRFMTGANSIRKPKEVLIKHSWIAIDEMTKVKCCKLDTFCRENSINHIDFIWADMQGAEYDMLLGGKEILKNTYYLYLEYSDIELYEGQKTVDQYMELLNSDGDHWEIIHKFSMDVLIARV